MSYFSELDTSQYLNELANHFGTQLPCPLIAIDDGYDQQNMAFWTLENGELTIGEAKIKSRGKRGRHASSMNMQAKGLYSSEGTDYTVSDSLKYEDTRSDDYPKTTLNRVLVHAALNSIGVTGGAPVALVTGLPLKEYAPRMGELNERLFEAKRLNMLTPVYVGVNRQPSARVCFHGTFPEAVAGIADYLIDNKGNLRDGMTIESVRMALDIGGKTTDMAVIINGQEVAAMETYDLGVSNIRERLTALVEDRLDLRLDPILVDQALNERVVEAFDIRHDVADLWETAVTEVFSDIFAQAEKMRRSFPSIKEIVCFGGGAALAEDVIRNKFPKVSMVANPDGANARGYLKFATLESLEDIREAVLAYMAEAGIEASTQQDATAVTEQA